MVGIEAPPEIVNIAEAGEQFASVEKLRSLLTESPRKLHESLVYNDLGSRMFAKLCRQPEYYPARIERNMLFHEAGSVISSAKPEHVVDLGCGTMEKSQILIQEAIKQGRLKSLVGCDIDSFVLQTALSTISFFYNDMLEIKGVSGDIETYLERGDSGGGRRLFLLLGLTFCNMSNDERESLLWRLRQEMRHGDTFLLSADLIKRAQIMEAAYKDAKGCSELAAFQTLNNLNDYFGANFDLSRFRHEACWVSDRAAVIERLISLGPQTVSVESLGMTLEIDEGEPFELMFSEKFHMGQLVSYFEARGFSVERTVKDTDCPYGLLAMRLAT